MSPYRSNNLFQVILELNKIKITVAVALTTLAGYILYSREFNFHALLPITGIFILACGASVINHIQERNTDGQMERTAKRPLPSGKISVKNTLLLAILEITSGLAILYFAIGLTPFILGLAALFWYNVIYINLKRITVHAVIPGSVIGAIPPLTGWVSAGGQIISKEALIIALFYFVWQVPHFYLLGFKYAEDYKNAGYPSLLEKYSPQVIWRIIFFWILFTVVTAILIPISGLTESMISFVFILIVSVWLIFEFSKPVVKKSPEKFRPVKFFMKINYFVLVVVLMQILDILLARII